MPDNKSAFVLQFTDTRGATFSSLFLILLCLLLSPQLAATEVTKKWYQIEYIVFEHLDSDRSVLTFEDVVYSLPKKKEYLHIVKHSEALSKNHLKQIPLDQFSLNNALSLLRKNNSIRVYTSGAWQHPLAKNEKLPPLKLDIDKTAVGGQHLKGEISIRRGRYMHVDTTLYLADFIALPYDDLQSWLLESNDSSWPVNWLVQPLAFQHPMLTWVGESLLAQNIVLLEQSRRIKDGEVHYLDHPALGLIITIQGIAPPFEYGDESYTN